MFFQNNKFKKTISTFLIVTFLVPSLFLTKPKEVSAIFGLGDTVIEVGGNLVTNVKNTIEGTIRTGYNAITSSKLWSIEMKEFILDDIAWVIAKQAVRQMTTSIVNWINSGFDGNPLFITDFRGMMTDIADGVIGEYIYGTELAFLCSPFSLEVKLALYNTFYGEEKTYDCTLSDIINNAGGALQSLEDDFRWGTWIEMTNEKSNNPYGVFLKAEEIILKEIGLAQEKTTLQASWGNGFISWEDCEEYEVNTPQGTKTAEKCTTQTPGSVIEELTSRNLDSGRESLITADEINEIIGALLMQLASSVMSSTGLLGQDMSSYEETEDLNSLQDEISDAVNESLETELEYNEIKTSSLDLVQEALDFINLLVDCLIITGENTKLDLANEFLNGNTYLPQTTINIDLNSLKISLINEIEISDNLIIEFNTILEETSNTTTPEELSDIMSNYTSLVSEAHTLTDISDATIENSGYGTIVDSLDNGLTYNIDWLINIFAEDTTNEGDGGSINPPENEKGIKQRYDECQICKTTLENGLAWDESIDSYCIPFVN